MRRAVWIIFLKIFSLNFYQWSGIVQKWWDDLVAVDISSMSPTFSESWMFTGRKEPSKFCFIWLRRIVSEIVHDSTDLSTSTNQKAGPGQVSWPEPIRALETNDCWRRQTSKVTETICQMLVLGKQRPDLVSSSNIWMVSLSTFHPEIISKTLKTYTMVALQSGFICCICWCCK